MSDSPIDPDGLQTFLVATRITVANGKVIQMRRVHTDSEPHR